MANRYLSKLDPAHANLKFFSADGISGDIWRDKYRWGQETDLNDTAARVARGVCANDTPEFTQQVAEAIQAGLLVPAGRILAGAGTTKVVTLMNCYVNKTMEDSLVDIMEGNKIQALTGQMGGGIGTPFHTLRPKGAWLHRTQTFASGPLPFMDMWNATCATIESAGQRRGAMMGTLTDWHPDLPEFITAKRTPGRLTNFNVSVLISDAFMEAVRDDEDWLLYHPAKPGLGVRSDALAEEDFEDDEGVHQYVYAKMRARDLWRMITENTYEYSEPGVIFIDRVNGINNLAYCEEIVCTNPCGEQPLPPFGTCNLGHVNLSRLVANPFTEDAHFQWDLFKEIIHTGIRFLDNVIDVTLYPMEEMKQEELNKRRLGLGCLGLADALAQLRLRYGSLRSKEFASKMQRFMAIEAYRASIALAGLRGSFPLYDVEGLLHPDTFISRRMPQDVIENVKEIGLRNGVLMSYAPTGTSTIPFGYPGGGLEPIFSHVGKRKVRQKNRDEWKEYEVTSYVYNLYRTLYPEADLTKLPSWMPEADALTVEEHIGIQGAIQEYVDASVSKTVNVPTSMGYEDFVRVYDLAYNLGCKGCTTYRYSEVRGSILSKGSASKPDERASRPDVLQGRTYKIKWPSRSSALYLTINDGSDDTPIEILITSKDASQAEWTTALTLMITGILRKGGDIGFVATELMSIQSVYDFAWIGGRRFGSLPAYIGYVLAKHLGIELEEKAVSETPKTGLQTVNISGSRIHIHMGLMCPKCQQPTLIKEMGCDNCTNCGYSKCE